MNPNAQKWVEALRSGEYPQTEGKLTRWGAGLSPALNRTYPVGHCCLGVACELAVKDGVEINVMHDERGYVHYDGEDNYLPPSVVEWLGFTKSASSQGVYKEDDNRVLSLAKLNDEGSTFNEIADVIEENAERLFR